MVRNAAGRKLRSVADSAVGTPSRKVQFRWPPKHEPKHPMNGEEVWSAGSAAASQPTTGLNPATSSGPWFHSAGADITHGGDVVPSGPERSWCLSRQRNESTSGDTRVRPSRTAGSWCSPSWPSAAFAYVRAKSQHPVYASSAVVRVFDPNAAVRRRRQRVGQRDPAAKSTTRSCTRSRRGCGPRSNAGSVRRRGVRRPGTRRWGRRTATPCSSRRRAPNRAAAQRATQAYVDAYLAQRRNAIAERYGSQADALRSQAAGVQGADRRRRRADRRRSVLHRRSTRGRTSTSNARASRRSTRA